MDRRQEKKLGSQDISYILTIVGFNNHSVGEEIIPEFKGNDYVSQSRC